MRTGPIAKIGGLDIAQASAERVAIEQLAQDAITPQERARHYTYAAEIDELRLDDDVSAAQLYARALADTVSPRSTV